MPIVLDQIPNGLPSGRLVIPVPRFAVAEPVTEPVLWITDDPIDPPDAGRHWADLLTRHRETGLWPLLLGEESAGSPWHSGELSPVPPDWADDIHVDTFFSQRWHDCPARERSPFGTWPGPAPGGERATGAPMSRPSS